MLKLLIDILPNSTSDPFFTCTCHRGTAEQEAVQMLVAEQLWLRLPPETQSQCRQAASGAVCSKHGLLVSTRLPQNRSPAGNLFLLQHRLLAPQNLHPAAAAARNNTLQSGAAQQALQLHRFGTAQQGSALSAAGAAAAAEGAGSLPAAQPTADQHPTAAAAVMQTALSVISGHLSAACAACDAAAVAQLEHLYMLCFFFLTPPAAALLPGVPPKPATPGCIAPTRPVFV